ICYTVCKPVWETKTREICYTVCKPVYETCTRNVCYSVCQPVCYTRVVKECCGRWETRVSECPGRVITKCVQDAGCWVWDPCCCKCVYKPGCCHTVQVQCPPVKVCKKVWVPEVREKTINCVKYVRENMTKQCTYTTCKMVAEQRVKTCTY